MKILDHHFNTPEQNLALDEAMLEHCENTGGGEVLRVWESSTPFIVLGLSNHWKEEVSVDPAYPNGCPLPILRRISGGGAVMQGPGCLNYALILKIRTDGPLRGILSANRFIMERNRVALEKLLGRPVRVQGSTDLTLEGLKFSGNSQRRKRNYLLFHGTFLLDFDLDLLEKYLNVPVKQPAYRTDRPHRAFVTNLGLKAEPILHALAKAWDADGAASAPPDNAIAKLVQEKYGKESWNLKH